MNGKQRMALLLSVCLGIFLLPLACRREPRVPSGPNGMTTAATAEEKEAAPPNSEYVATLKRHIVERTTVTSKYEVLDDNRILRFENSLVKISFSVRDIIAFLEEAGPMFQGKTLADRLRSENGICSDYRYEDLSREERGRLDYCLADLLKKGTFLLVSSSTGKRVPKIRVCVYAWTVRPLCGVGGRIFFLENGKAFFMIRDWIS